MQEFWGKLDSTSIDTSVKMNIEEWISFNYAITSNEAQNIFVCFIPSNFFITKLVFSASSSAHEKKKS